MPYADRKRVTAFFAGEVRKYLEAHEEQNENNNWSALLTEAVEQSERFKEWEGERDA